MKQQLSNIRLLLDEIEEKFESRNNDNIKETFDLFELPEIIKDIVDYLQPLLSPYEMDIYWFMFRNSILESGDVYIRASNSKIAKGIGTKFKNQSNQSSRFGEKTVTENLRTLEESKVIKKVGETNREGTLFQIFLPEEIDMCKEQMKQVQQKNLPFVDPKKEQDYYNIKENRIKIFERDKYLCYKCNKQLTRFSATLDHINPVSKGGDNSYDNLATCCFHCNSNRRNIPISDFIE